MKSYIASFLAVFVFCALPVAANVEILKNRAPKLSADKVVDVTKKYLAGQKHFDLNKYELIRVSYNYFSDTEMFPMGEWTLIYDVKAHSGPGSSIVLIVSNESSPVITQLPSM